MGENTAIEWATHTFNPWIGCTKVSPACAHCYAESYANRYGRAKWGPGQPRSRTSESNWRKPLRWNREAAESGTRPRVFCSSLADVFDREVPQEWREDLFELISETPNLDWLLLTKRPEVAAGPRAEGGLPWIVGPERHYAPWANVWLGVTVEDQKRADERIPILLSAPAVVRFLSMEPLLGPVRLDRPRAAEWRCDECGFLLYRRIVDMKAGVVGENRRLERIECQNGCGLLRQNTDLDQLSWVIAGGESGAKARQSHPDWFRSLRDQCAAAGVPFLFKQWGEWSPPPPGLEFNTAFGLAGNPPAYLIGPEGDVCCFYPGGENPSEKTLREYQSTVRIGKKKAGRHLDGRLHDEIPNPAAEAANAG